jgi:4-amino-4-deoxy-L-arabinose transferase-like glycosyltransferase
LAVAVVLRLVWLWWPHDALIFDEAYYVNAARVIAERDVSPGDPYAGSTPGLDPNSPHPPLGKALIAGSIVLFGDGGIGWRLPSVIAAMISLVAVYAIVRASGETPWLGSLAVGLFAFDNLAFVHGRIGTLDMMSLAPILLGAWLALRGRWAWAGAACAVGTLVKLTAIFGVVAILAVFVFDLFRRYLRTRRVRIADFRPALGLLISYALVSLLGLWILDLRFTTFVDPFSHLAHMVSYGASLQTTGGSADIASYPWQWLVNDVEINYLRIAVDTTVDGSIVSSEPTIDFRGALNPVLIGAAPIAFLFAVALAWRAENRLAMWCVLWAAATYLPYYALVLVGHRITYLYYVLPAVPALAVAVALLLARANLPRIVAFGYVIGIGLAFVAYFPFRQLP